MNNDQEMAWRKEVNLDEWIRQYSIRRYKEQSPELTRVWEILLPRIYHERVHLWPHPPMIMEPHFGRYQNATNYPDIVEAYHILRKVWL